METKNTLLLNIRREFIENRKAILLSVGTLWGVCILIGGILGYYGLGGGNKEIFLFGFLLIFCSYAFTSVMFSDMKRKETRISTLMVPASTFDKFFTRWLACVPALFLILIISFYIGDASRIIVNAVANNPNTGEDYSRFVNIWKTISSGPLGHNNYQVLTLFSSYLFYQSIYLLGAILMPKLSFIKTSAALWIIETILGIMMVSFRNYISFVRIDETNYQNFYVISGTIFILLTLGIYYLVYYRLKRSQVIYRLF